MRKYYLIFAILFFSVGLNSQQIPPLSQYTYNHYAINPAATGITDDLPLSFTFRKMWAGISGSPSIQYLSGNMNIAKSMGAGINIFNYVPAFKYFVTFRGIAPDKYINPVTQ